MPKYLSVIVPVYNETKRVNNLLHIANYLKRQKFSSQITVVNDGSVDDTLKKIKKVKSLISTPLVVISYPKNMGKGYAVKTGILSSNSNFNLFMDIDLSTPIEEFDKFKEYLNKYPIIIGTRKHPQAVIKKRQTQIRSILGKGFSHLSNTLLSTNISDVTCGFKCFNKSASQKVFSKSKIFRWGFDAEIFLLAKKFSLPVKEIPINWLDSKHSKVKLKNDLIYSLYELMVIKVNSLIGKYDI